MGKDVVVVRRGEEPGETDNLIKLPAPPDGITHGDYLRCLYRDREGVVKSFFDITREEKEDGRSFIWHFSGVPHLIKKLEDCDFTNVSVENLHTGEKRRYIVKGHLMEFFMLEGELFSLLYMEQYYPSQVVRCSTGEVYTLSPDIYHVIACVDYVAALRFERDRKTLVLIKTARKEE